MNNYWLWAFLVLILFIACDREAENPRPLPDLPTFEETNLLPNGSFEVGEANVPNSGFASDSIPSNWEALTGPTYESRWVRDTAPDGNRAISISGNWVDPAALAYVTQSLPIPQSGKKYRLSLRMRTENVEGEGMGIEIQADDAESNSDPEYRISLQGTPILGSRDWTQFVLTTEALPESLSSISVFIQMKRSTTGRAFIDQVELQMEE